MSYTEEKEFLSEEAFVKKLSTFQQLNPRAVSKFKSTGRAQRRGHLMKNGMIVPTRVHHNRKNTCKRKGCSSRRDNDIKKEMWLGVKEAARQVLEDQKQHD